MEIGYFLVTAVIHFPVLYLHHYLIHCFIYTTWKSTGYMSSDPFDLCFSWTVILVISENLMLASFFAPVYHANLVFAGSVMFVSVGPALALLLKLLSNY